ncbi:hypothetical protein GCM10009872_47410 [Actinopolymorpha rutila]
MWNVRSDECSCSEAAEAAEAPNNANVNAAGTVASTLVVDRIWGPNCLSYFGPAVLFTG